MKEYLSILRRTKIFENLTDDEILSAISCLNATINTYKKDELIFAEDDEASFVGIILSGEIQTQKNDYNGNINIISKLFSTNLIAAVASYSVEKRLPFDVVAVCDSTVLYLNNENLIHQCCKACVFHTNIISNMLRIIAEKNIELSNKINILTKRTIREKILSFLYSQSKKAKGKNFSINLSRRQMAEFLSVNRSALSRELSNLQNEGILNFSDNHFSLK